MVFSVWTSIEICLEQKVYKILFCFFLNVENDGLPKDSVIQTAYHEALDKIEQLVQRKEAATDPQTI